MGAYNVIFTGRIAEGTTQQQAEEKLLRLLGGHIDGIRPFFQGKVLLLKKNLPRNRADAFAKAFTQAGAICRVRKSGPVSKQADDSGKPATGAEPITVVSPMIGHAQLAFTPMQSPFLTSAEGGININRKDRTFVSFEDISLMAVAYDSARGKSVLRLLVFIRPQKRPMIVDAEKIAYGGFPDISGNNLLSSLRRFLTFLLEKNSSIMIDEETHAFLKGGRPSEKERDINALATALAGILPSDAGGGKAIEPQLPAAPVRPAVATHASHDPAKVFIAEPAGKAASETPPMEHTADEPMLEKGKIRMVAIVYFALSLFFCLGLISFISQISREAGSPRSKWGPSISGPVAGQFFQESPALKRQRELLEYNRKGAQLTAVIGLIICALLATFFFRKARRYWTIYQELD